MALQEFDSMGMETADPSVFRGLFVRSKGKGVGAGTENSEGYKQRVVVSAVQMRIHPHSTSVNLGTARRLMREIHGKQKPDLVVFPEDCITGAMPYRSEVGNNENAYFLRTFQDLAREYGTYIIPGTFINNVRGKYYNTSVLIDPNGEVIHRHHKTNLWRSERGYLNPGGHLDCASTPLGNIGIIICHDLADPKISFELAKKGAEIICCPVYWTRDMGASPNPAGNGSMDNAANALCQKRAAENNALVVFANGAGNDGHGHHSDARSTFIGQTQVVSPEGVLGRIDGNEEGFVTCVYDRDEEYKVSKHFC